MKTTLKLATLVVMSTTILFGCNNTNTNPLVNSSGNATSPFFFVGNLPEINKWYLLVGHIFDENYTDFC
jgi:hypothetical protein